MLKVVKGNLSTCNDGRVVSNIMGIIDTKNANNTVSILDILTNQRIGEVVNNLGIELTLHSTLFDINSSAKGFVPEITYKLKEHIKPNAIGEIEIQSIDLWDGDDAAAVEKLDVELAGLVKSFSPQECTKVANKLALEAYQCFNYCFNVYSGDEVETEYTIYSYDYNQDGEVRLNSVIPMTKSLTDLRMDRYNSQITLPETSYYEIACNNNREKYFYLNPEVLNIMEINEDTGEIEESISTPEAIEGTTSIGNDNVTNNFISPNLPKEVTDKLEKEAQERREKDRNYINEEDWSTNYRPIEINPLASGEKQVEVTKKNTDGRVPIISFDSIIVKSITDFCEYKTIKGIPEGAFKIDSETNTRYNEKHLKGDVNNNELSIQDNERALYNYLNRLMTVGISIDNKALSDDEYNKIKDEKKSFTVESYIKILARQAYNLNWAHTGLVDYRMTSDVKETENDNETGSIQSNVVIPVGEVLRNEQNNEFYFSSVCSSDTFIRNSRSESPESNRAASAQMQEELSKYGTGFNGSKEVKHPILQRVGTAGAGNESAIVGFVEQSSDRDRWISALIMLLRWGEVKPTVLTHNSILGNNNDDGEEEQSGGYWDLNSGSMTFFSGDITKYKKVENNYGGIKSTSELNGTVCTSLRLPTDVLNKFYPGIVDDKDTVYNLEVPIGVRVLERFENNVAYQYTYMDIFTFRDKVKAEPKDSSYGNIRYVDGRFEIVDGAEVDMIRLEADKTMTSLLQLKDGCIPSSANLSIVEPDLVSTEQKKVYVSYLSNREHISYVKEAFKNLDMGKKAEITRDIKYSVFGAVSCLSTEELFDVLSKGSKVSSTGDNTGTRLHSGALLNLIYKDLPSYIKLSEEMANTKNIVDVLNAIDSIVLGESHSGSVNTGEENPLEKYLELIKQDKANIIGFVTYCIKHPRTGKAAPVFTLGKRRDKSTGETFLYLVDSTHIKELIDFIKETGGIAFKNELLTDGIKEVMYNKVREWNRRADKTVINNTVDELRVVDGNTFTRLDERYRELGIKA